MTTTTDATTRPWASFCMATFRRPERLESTIRAILSQTFRDFEIVVSDNDPARSGAPVIDRIGDSRIRYFANDENVGMVVNFNRALSHATGSYVIMITDDDPVQPTMLQTLRDLWTKHPQFGAYYGACEVDFQDETVAAKYGRPPGKVQLLAPRPEGDVWRIDAADFPTVYFRGQVFPYVLWSCGMVRRDIALEIGGMPDYGSPFLTDFGYIVLAGSRAGCCCVNTMLGFQAVHSGNFGRREVSELIRAVQGFEAHVEKRMSHRPGWPAERRDMETMLSNWVAAHLRFLWEFHRDSGRLREVAVELLKSLRVPYLRHNIGRLTLELTRKEARLRLSRFLRP
jgi:hypothetical protein